MRLEHHLVGGYVRYKSPHIIIIIIITWLALWINDSYWHPLISQPVDAFTYILSKVYTLALITTRLLY